MTQVYEQSYSFPYGEELLFLTGAPGSGSIFFGGELALLANAGSSASSTGTYTLDAWCVDLDDTLNYNSTYVTQPLNVNNSAAIASLAAYGTKQLALMGSSNPNAAVFSAAVQAAIWELEYPGLGLSTQTSAAVLSEVQTLKELLPYLPSGCGGEELAGSRCGATTGAQNLYVAPPQLTVVKTPSVTATTAGGQITYTISVTNTGGVTLTGVTVTDKFSNGAPNFTSTDQTALAPGATYTVKFTTSATSDSNNGWNGWWGGGSSGCNWGTSDCGDALNGAWNALSGCDSQNGSWGWDCGNVSSSCGQSWGWCSDWWQQPTYDLSDQVTATGTPASGSGFSGSTSATAGANVVVLGSNVSNTNLVSTYGAPTLLEMIYNPGTVVNTASQGTGSGTAAILPSSLGLPTSSAYLLISNSASDSATGSGVIDFFKGSVSAGDTIFAGAWGGFPTGTDLYAHVFLSQAAFQAGTPAIQEIRYDTSGHSGISLGDTVGSLQVAGYISTSYRGVLT